MKTTFLKTATKDGLILKGLLYESEGLSKGTILQSTMADS